MQHVDVEQSAHSRLAIVGLSLVGILAAVLAYALMHSALVPVVLLGGVAAFVCFNLGVERSTGLFLMLIPTNWLVIALLQLNGVAQYQTISALKEVLLVLALGWFLAHARDLTITGPDVLLISALLIVLAEQVFVTNPKGARDDWEWTLAYFLGRVLMLSPSSQAIWAKCAVWMCATLAVLGALEVLYLGQNFRLSLLLLTQGDTSLPAYFLANGYEGFRAASTMVSPLAFSGLCVVGLLLWWTYMKNPVPALLIGFGLGLTLTRSAVVAGLLGIVIIGVRRRETKRLLLWFGVIAFALLIAIPTLGLLPFLQNTLAGRDTSAEGHQTSLVVGVEKMVTNPLGLGAGSVSPRNLQQHSNALDIEDSFLTIAVEYGILTGLLNVAFILLCCWQLFQVRTPIGYAGLAILIAYSALLFVGPLHLDVPLSCWVWVPVGIGVTAAARQRVQEAF